MYRNDCRSGEIKIAIFQSVSERQRDDENRRQIAGESQQKLRL